MTVTDNYAMCFGHYSNNTLNNSYAGIPNPESLIEAEKQDGLYITSSSLPPTSNEFQDNYQKDLEQIKRYRQAFQLNDNDNVKVFVIPKGCSRIKPGSFIYKPTASVKTFQLTATINRTKQKIAAIESGIANSDLSEGDKARQIAALRHNIEQYKSSLSKEQIRLSNMPASGYVVIERE